MFTTLLIANRGEIACRVARTARRLGIETVAVYSEADAGALHVKAADRAYPIGAAPARESYLNIDRIIETAKRAGAQAIHPGYGFLSENPAFAEACQAAGIVFVGPSAAAMRAMGSKSAAKALMEQSGVPVLPGYHGEIQDPAFLAEQAARIGYPVAIKAVAGGGGRGLRVVHDPADFAAALASARQEGASSFGDDRVLIERYLDRPRHIEVQVFGDHHGNAVHLFERDCSAQRRHQKVIEEAPAPNLSPERRTAMGEAAVLAARAVGYVGAGTVEFIADDRGFAFLEMNTRLQVEHPVTECVTGFDLVEWQLRVAAGEPLPARQEMIPLHGHAFEARIYAEDPARDFAPSVGRLSLFRLPPADDGVRVDTGFGTGDTVSIHYDAMLAKLICHGADRATALRVLRQALDACEVVGVASNLDLLGRIARHTLFEDGGIDTGFIAREGATLLASQAPPPAEVLAGTALAELMTEAEDGARVAADSGDPHSPWHARDGWWVNASAVRVLPFEADGQVWPVSAVAAGDGWDLTLVTTTHRGHVARGHDGGLQLALDGVRVPIAVARDGEMRIVRWRGETWRLALPDPAAHIDDEQGGGDRLLAPIPGQVTQVVAEPGMTVARGDILVVLEAMKTVFRLPAPADAVVASVTCAVGEMVQDGQVLVTFVTDDPEDVSRS
ncbi:MAG: biotin carboxylase N-terminal domain-containing protein [Acetobacteraceae bacterium]